METQLHNHSGQGLGEDATVILSAAIFFGIALGAILLPQFIFTLPLVWLVPALFGRRDIFAAGLLAITPFVLSREINGPIREFPETAIRLGFICVLLFGLALTPRARMSNLAPIVITWGLMFAFAAATAPYISMYPNISALKALFAAVIITLLLVLAGRDTRFPLVLAGIACAVSIGSLACYFVYPKVGFGYREFLPLENKYSGLISHPQMYGCFLGISAPLILHLLLTRNGAPRLFYFLAFISLLAGLYISASRTGTLAFAASSSAYLLAAMARGRSPTLVRAAKTTTFLMVAFGALASAFAWQELQSFAKKNDGAGEMNLSRRDEVIQMSWEGFLASPIIGNGFQVPSTFSMRKKNDLSLEDSTAIEKCFAGTMILEETGVIGAALFLAGAIFLLSECVRRRAYLCLATFVGFAAVNLGEAVVFSPSGLGGVCWLMALSTYNVELE